MNLAIKRPASGSISEAVYACFLILAFGYGLLSLIAVLSHH